MDKMFLSYVAGFFDGEGSAYEGSHKDRHGKRRPVLVAKIAQVDRTILDTIAKEFGCGKVYSKSDKRIKGNENWSECFDVQFTRRAAREFLTTIEPYLVVKKEKVSALLDVHGREF